MDADQAHATSGRCENCAAALAGGYCHACGQRAHNPLRDLRHAVEDVFESFWHVDGRIFRTLVDLLSPGRVAANYLAGHRVRYIAPLRLFVILSLLTFFVGRSTLDPSPVDAPPGTSRGISVDVRGGAGADGDAFFLAAKDPAAVMRVRREKMVEATASVEGELGRIMLPVLEQGMRRHLDAGARRRLAALGVEESEVEAMLAREPFPSADRSIAPIPESATGDQGNGWQQRWIRKRSERLASNVERIANEPGAFIGMFLGALPGALFVLVPLFAVFLKLMYLGSGRGYLEHLVVALYSHAALLLALLAVFLAAGMEILVPVPGWVADVLGLALAVGVALYLLWMQKRVYAQGWPVTLLKYLVIGGVYSLLLSVAILYALLSGLTS
jgi:hypothetical protein